MTEELYLAISGNQRLRYRKVTDGQIDRERKMFFTILASL